MKTFFVEQSNRTGKLKSVFKKVIQNDNKIIINLNLEKVKFKTKIILVKKIINILEAEKSRQIVLEEKLKQDKQFMNLLLGYNINICNPKWLFKRMINDIIDNVLKDKKKEESDIYICVNEIDFWIEEFIENGAKSFKNINIITNHIGRFKKIAERLFNNEGILINLSNNKRKSLVKANLILNLDFPKELLNKYNIFNEATIIDIEGELKTVKKNFRGKIINDYKVKVKEGDEVSKYIKENKLENYDIREICQAIEKVPKFDVYLTHD